MTLSSSNIHIVLLALLVWAGVEDVRRRRIPNWLTLTVIVSGLGQSLTPGSTVTPLQSMLGLMLGLTVAFGMFAMDALGAGDVKLLAGVGAWVGGPAILSVLALTAIVGGILILLQSLWQRRTLVLLRSTALIVINLMNIRRLGADHVKATGRASRSVEGTVPYAVPIAVGTALTLFTPLPSWFMRT